jgi:hypothetical protein
MCVDKMMADGEMSMDDMNLFLYMKWWNGFFWIIARYPILLKKLELNVSLLPHVMFAVGKHCKITIMSWIVGNELDVIEHLI